MDIYDLMREKVPSHLNGLRTEIVKVGYVNDISDTQYAEIAFKLMLAGEGDKDALKEVALFIQNQQRDLKRTQERLKDFVLSVRSWLYWAKFWTKSSSTHIDEKDMVLSD